MLDPMPRQDVKLPPTPREAELMAEVERLRKMLTDHGIDPDSEYIAPNGLRVDAPASKTPVNF